MMRFEQQQKYWAQEVQLYPFRTLPVECTYAKYLLTADKKTLTAYSYVALQGQDMSGSLSVM